LIVQSCFILDMCYADIPVGLKRDKLSEGSQIEVIIISIYLQVDLAKESQVTK